MAEVKVGDRCLCALRPRQLSAHHITSWLSCPVNLAAEVERLLPVPVEGQIERSVGRVAGQGKPCGTGASEHCPPPAATILPSDWMATSRASSPRVVRLVRTRPSVLNDLSSPPFGLWRAIAKLAGPLKPRAAPAATIFPSPWRATAKAMSSPFVKSVNVAPSPLNVLSRRPFGLKRTSRNRPPSPAARPANDDLAVRLEDDRLGVVVVGEVIVALPSLRKVASSVPLVLRRRRAILLGWRPEGRRTWPTSTILPSAWMATSPA